MFKRLITSHTFRTRVALGVTIMLLVPFAIFFTANQLPFGRHSDVAGIVFGKDVPVQAFQDEQRWIRPRIEQQLGQQSGQLISILTTQQAWETFMLEEEAKRSGLRVDDQELAAFLRHLAAFQDHGVFRPERYHGYIQTAGLTPQTFETLIRRDLLVEKLVHSIEASVRVSDDEVTAASRQAHESLKASVIRFTPEPFIPDVSAAITDADLRARYEAQPDEVRVPEQLVMEYAGRSREAQRLAVRLEDEAVDEYYRDHPSEFANEDGTPQPLETVAAAIRDQLLDARARQQLTALTLDLEEDVAARRSFEEILNTRGLPRASAGPVAADQASTLTTPEPSLLREVAQLQEGRMSGVLEIDEGVYVARLVHRVPAHLPPFEEVRAKIRARLVQEHAQARARASADTLRAMLKDRQAAGIRFEEAVRIAGVTPTHATFTRTQPIDPIGSVPEVNTAAFALPLGEISMVLEVPSGFVIVRPEERIPADEASLATFTEAVREEIVKARRSKRLQEWLDEVRKRANLQRL